MSIIKKWGVATNLLFPIITSGSTEFTSGSTVYTPVAGDVLISKDYGAAANTASLPSYHSMGNGVLWNLPLSAAEMQANDIVITIIDAAPKTIEDQAIHIQTYGSSGSGALNMSDWADETIKRDYRSISSIPEFSLGGNTRALHYWETSGSTYTVRQEDGVTQAWAATLALASSGSAVTGVTK